MNCLELAAMALRLVSVDGSGGAVGPGIAVRSGCGVELGAYHQSDDLTFTAGYAMQSTDLPVWINLGGQLRRKEEGFDLRQTPRGGRLVGQAESKIAIGGDGKPKRSWKFGKRISVHAKMPILGGFALRPEIEFTDHVRALISIEKAF